MPLVNKDEYNAYMRKQMKQNYWKNKGQKIMKDKQDYNGTDRPMLDLSQTAELVKETKNLLKNGSSDQADVDDDPVLKAIDKYAKYIPLVLQFVQGMQGSMQQQQQQRTPAFTAPEGWLNMSPMQKLGRKYSQPEWFAAGEAYDLAAQGISPRINVNHVDRSYSPPAQNLQSLARKYPEPPIVQDQPKPEPVKQPDQNSQNSQIINELQQDNAKYIELGANYINGLTDEEFLKHTENIDSLVEKARPLIPIIPIHVKGMIMQTPLNDFESLLKERCKQKYDLLVKENKLSKILNIFDGLKVAIVESAK